MSRYNVKKELTRIGTSINSSEASDVAQFKKYYQEVQHSFGGQTMQWVRFTNFEDFKSAVQALLYVSMFYTSFLTKNQAGLREDTGYTKDPSHTYSWWRLNDPGIDDIIVDGKLFNPEASVFEIRQPIARFDDYFEVRLRIREITEEPLDWS